MGSYLGYVKAALTSQYNLLFLAGTGMISLISGNIFPLLIGLGGEAVWLAAAPVTPAYRRIVDKKIERHARLDAENELAKLSRILPTDLRARFDNMVRQVNEIRAHNSAQDSVSRIFLDSTTARLDDMLHRYARMLNANHRWAQHALSGNRASIEERLNALPEETDGDAELAAAHDQQRRLLEQRMEKLDKAERDNRLLVAQIATLEDAMGLLRDQALTLSRPEEMTERIDDFLDEVAVTEQTVSALESSFATLFDRELKQAEETRRLGTSSPS